MANIKQQLEQALMSPTWKQNASWWGKPSANYDGLGGQDPRDMIGPEDMVSTRNVEDITAKAKRSPNDWYSFAKNSGLTPAGQVNRNVDLSVNADRIQQELGSPVAQQNKAAKNNFINNRYNSYAGGEFEPDVHSVSAQRTDNYMRQIEKNPNQGVYEVGPYDGYSKMRDTEALPHYNATGYSKPLVNKLAVPIGRLPVVGALSGAQGVAGASDLYNNVKQNGPIAGYTKWLGMQTKNPTTDYE